MCVVFFHVAAVLMLLLCLPPSLVKAAVTVRESENGAQSRRKRLRFEGGFPLAGNVSGRVRVKCRLFGLP